MTKTHIKKRRNLPLNALRSFEAAARLGRQNVASDEISVTHGAISRQITKLEDFLDVKLFSGSRRLPVLTPAGKALLQGLTPAFDQIDEAVRGAMNKSEGMLVACCYTTFAMRWLIPRLFKFRGLHPNIAVQFSTDSPDTLVEHSGHDIIIKLLDSPTELFPEDVVLMSEKLGLVISPEFVKKDTIFSMDTLAAIPRLDTRTRKSAWSKWLNIMGAPFETMEFKTAEEYEHYYLTIEAVANNLGSCVVPQHLVSDFIQSGRLVAPFGFVESGAIYIIRTNRTPNKISKLFCDWMKKEAQDL